MKIVSTFILGLIIIVSLFKLTSDGSHTISQPVNELSDLSKIELKSSIQEQFKTHNSFIDHIDTSPDSFVSKNVTGFVSNLDETKYLLQNDNNDDNKLYKDVIDCNDLQYNSILKYQVNNRKGNDDLIAARREILAWNNDEITKKVQDKDEEKDMTEEEIVNKHWFEFGHMSVWLETEQCYLTYSRIIYTRRVKNLPEISLIKAAAYDKDWNEIKGKRIPYLDVIQPENFEQELQYLDEQLGLNKCRHLESNDLLSEYEECMKNQVEHNSKNEKRKQQILDKYFITYPTVLKFSFKLRPNLSGPEDPHVILKKHNDGIEEPILVFNLDDGTDRKIHSILPYRRVPTLVKFHLPEKKALERTEKNWSPFFLPEVDSHHSLLSRGYIHFVHSLVPLRILRCSLDDGSCEEKFNGDLLNLSPDNKDGSLRGGTQFVPLPDVIPGIKGKNIWVSFAKTHNKKCGCGPNFYRAVLVVMIEQDGVYHLELIAPGIDFGFEPLNFDMTGTSCKGKNIITPNSIVSWFVASQDESTHSFEDYLTLTVSEADAVTKRIVVNGVLDYILNIYKVKHIKDTFSVDDQADAIIDSTRRCVAKYALDVCKKYGETHPE